MAHQDTEMQGRVLQTLERNGRSWRDYVLLLDAAPASILSVSPDGVAILHIDDPALAAACQEFLTDRGARTFSSFDELDQAVGIKPGPIVRPHT